MLIKKAFKVRIYPNKEQQEFLNKTFGCSRWIYNYYLNHRVEYFLENSSMVGYKRPTEASLKKEFEFLKSVDATSLQQARIDLETAFKNYFDKHKKKTITKWSDEKRAKKLNKSYKTKVLRYIKTHPDHPKFHSKHDINSFRCSMNIKVDNENRKIKIPKINWIKFKDSRNIDGELRNITISKNKSGQYFASILVNIDLDIKDLKNDIDESKVFSADMSCKDFLISDDEKFENQKFFRLAERRLKIRQRSMDRKSKDSRKRSKQQLKVAKTHRDIANKRKGYQQNLAYHLVQKYDALIFEDLNIEGMKRFNSGISKTVTSDFSFSEFLLNIEWQCFKQSKHFVKVDRFFPSSKTCFNCGNVKSKDELKLSDRLYICECGYTEDRDFNAARNIKKEGIRILKEKGINLLKNSTDVDYSRKVTPDRHECRLRTQIGKPNAFRLG